MKKITDLLNNVESKITDLEIINLPVSASSVGWHIEHTFLTINAIIDQLKKCEPEKYKSTFSIAKMYVFTLNKIPRGRGKAPSIVIPQQYNTRSLKIHFEKTKNNLRELEVMNADNYFVHPFFGHLKLKPTIKFLAIHTKHHLDIINDILR